MLRADRSAGESLGERDGGEHLQSPFVLAHGGKYWMFYGGHGTGDTKDCQICLMTSDDGRSWSRHRNAEGFSRVFTGPGEARDPCVININGLWHLYYVGWDAGNRPGQGYFVRTSRDLIDWSDARLVQKDPLPGSESWDVECPLVVEREGYYYLFRTEEYDAGKMHVFRSEDPLDFGIGEARNKYVCPISVAGPEIVFDENGREFISSSHDLAGGISLCRLRWVGE
jgi:beta-fructofuranosidase